MYDPYEDNLKGSGEGLRGKGLASMRWGSPGLRKKMAYFLSLAPTSVSLNPHREKILAVRRKRRSTYHTSFLPVSRTATIYKGFV